MAAYKGLEYVQAQLKEKYSEMADNQGVAKPGIDQSIPEIACDLVYGHILENLEKTDTHITFGRDEVYCVWFAFVLGNYKALVSSSLPDGRYYEVTYDKNKTRVYIDTYVKVDNRCIINPHDEPSPSDEIVGEYHDGATVSKVFLALADVGIQDPHLTDAVTAMQNAGILFRERI